MAAEHKYFKIRRFPLVAGVWTPITVPPGEYSRVVIEAADTAVNMDFRSDSDDGMTEKQIPMGMELNANGNDICFQGGDVVGYVKVASGTGPAIVSYTR